jgi:L,D-transpeptidase catalytic domain
MLKRTLQAGFLGFICLFSGATVGSVMTNTGDSSSIDAQAKAISAKAQHLNPKVVELGLEAYQKARAQGLDKKEMLTIVDYSKPSTEPRLWVVNLKNDEVLYQTLVAHGKNSGGNMATRFSNRPQSEESSLGLYLTGDTYSGEHGYSLRLEGLEKGFNSNAESRAIVMHSAWYVSQSFADSEGRLGRSWGCMALNPKVAPEIIHTIKDGTLIFAYYPEKAWLDHSKYLT